MSKTSTKKKAGQEVVQAVGTLQDYIKVNAPKVNTGIAIPKFTDPDTDEEIEGQPVEFHFTSPMSEQLSPNAMAGLDYNGPGGLEFIMDFLTSVLSDKKGQHLYETADELKAGALGTADAMPLCMAMVTTIAETTELAKKKRRAKNSARDSSRNVN